MIIESFIKFACRNYMITLFVIGIISALISLWKKPRPWHRKIVINAIFSYFLLFCIGIVFIYGGLFHIFFPKMIASFIGWETSPFQLEVGFASLGFGIVGLIAFRGRLNFQAAAIIGPAVFLWGAAGGHIYQMISAHNFSPGNAGVILWTDILLPIIGFILLYLQYKLAPAEPT